VTVGEEGKSLYALRFISGKYQGGEYPLRMNREIVIGRASDLDMVLVEDMVSRKHAAIITTGGQVELQDLGSTNGTFVNGEKIKRVRLKEGDRILIGTSIIKVVTITANAADISDSDVKMRLEQVASRRRTTGIGRPMSGSIEEIPLPDLLQLLSTSRKSGVLSIHRGNAFGRIYLRKGQIYFATLDDAFDIQPRKALFRILTWSGGTFELDPPDDKAVLEELKESTEALLMEGMRQLDETRRLEQELPPFETFVSLAMPLQSPLRALGEVELDVLQQVLNHPGKVQLILDRSPHTDLDTLHALHTLLDREYIALQSGAMGAH
jgi:hypothetical protein